MATREPLEGRISTRTRARTRENGRGEGTSGRSGGREHFHRGRPSEGPPPSLETARLLPSKPGTRTVVSPPPTSDEALGGVTPLHRNRPPPSVTPVPSLSPLVPQSLGEGLAAASTSSLEGALPPQADLRTLCRLARWRVPQRRLLCTIPRLWKERGRRSHHRR